MDMFKIVSTKEKMGVCFTAVPHQWESNGTLFWPEHLNHKSRNQVRSNPASIPSENWIKYDCILKYKNISTFNEALQLEKQYSEFTDTEQEESLLVQNLTNKRRIKSTYNSFKDYFIPDRNNMIATVMATKCITPTNDESSVIHVISDEKLLPYHVTEIEDTPLIVSDNCGASDNAVQYTPTTEPIIECDNFLKPPDDDLMDKNLLLQETLWEPEPQQDNEIKELRIKIAEIKDIVEINACILIVLTFPVCADIK